MRSCACLGSKGLSGMEIWRGKCAGPMRTEVRAPAVGSCGRLAHGCPGFPESGSTSVVPVLTAGPPPSGVHACSCPAGTWSFLLEHIRAAGQGTLLISGARGRGEQAAEEGEGKKPPIRELGARLVGACEGVWLCRPSAHGHERQHRGAGPWGGPGPEEGAGLAQGQIQGTDVQSAEPCLLPHWHLSRRHERTI